MQSSEKSMSKLTPKYNCMVSGQKRMQPCAGCSNPKGCMSQAMQYKENEMDKKPVVKINLTTGKVQCAKGLGDECGYKGEKVCGKCGATAVVEKAAMSKPEDEEEMIDMEGGPMAAEDMPEDMPEDEEDAMKMRKRAKNRRLQTMGMKSADFSEDGFLCAIERKMHPNGGQVCATCPGGCAPEGNLPTIIEVEGLAEEMFGGKVLDSGYGYASDLFLVEMQRKDGKVVEVVFDGSSAEVVGWQLLNDSVTGSFSQKSAQISVNVIGMDEAADLAVKSIQGEVVAIDADMFEGIDAWAVEINGKDGRSYDVYVSLDGEVVGYDAYDAEEAAAIDAEVAEIALKRAYSDNQRETMAEEGMAMPDGSFPIGDEADLRNAIQAFGRAKDKEAAKRHIMKRARDLGMEDLIPANWSMGKKDDASSDEGEEDNEFLASLMEFEVLTAESEIDSI